MDFDKALIIINIIYTAFLVFLFSLFFCSLENIKGIWRGKIS